MVKTRRAFTLVEMLVNIAIIGLLISLLLPAVQSAREAARRTTCANNFRQVGIGMQSYHSAMQVFPSGVFWWESLGEGSNSDIPADCSRPSIDEDPILDQNYYGWGWGTFLLPYIEETALYDQFDFKRGPHGAGCTAGKNYRAGAEFVNTYTCSSDPQSHELVALDFLAPAALGQSNDFANSIDPENLKDFAITNMVGVMGHGALNLSDGWSAKESVGTGAGHFGRDCNSSNAPRSNANGIMFNRSRIDASKVTDGLSKTLIVAEVRGAGHGSYRGYFWVSWNVETADHGINNIVGQLIRANLYPKTDWRGKPAGGFGSYHPGGCNLLMADGSVHFLSEDMDHIVLAAMSTRAGNEATTTE